MRNSKMRVEYRPIDGVIPYENNPRNNSESVAKVANSISRFGWKQPICVDSDGVIVAGHTRWLAARQLNLETVPVVVADDLTPAEIQAYRIADNSTNSLSSWNLDKLQVELDGLSVDFDMEDFGLDTSSFATGVLIDGFGVDFSLPDGDGPQFKTVSMHLTQEQYEIVMEALDRVDDCSTEGGNETGRKVAEVCRLWAGL